VGKFYFADYANGEIWVMTWENLRNLILGGLILTGDATLSGYAYLIADGFNKPGTSR